MKTAGAFALLVLASLLVAPPAAAQAPTGVTVMPGTLSAPIPYEGSANLPVTIEVGCATILEAMANAGDGSAPLAITVESPPSWLTVGDASADLADPATAQGCLTGAGTYTHQAELPLTVAADAPGVEDNIISLVATVGSTASEPAAANFTVAYNVEYTLTPDVTFPLAVTAAKTTFNLTVTQASNARSMVMMENISESAGDIAGLASEVYENAAGAPATKVFKITFSAPTSDNWTAATVGFTAYGHYLLLDGRAGEFDAGTPVTWEFTNGGVQGEHEHDGEEQESPAPVGAFLVLGLLALAMLVRRRGA